MSEYKPEDLERQSETLRDLVDKVDAAHDPRFNFANRDALLERAAMLRAGAQAMRDLIEAKAERDVAVISKENAEIILQTLNQDDLRHQWIAMKTHREAEAKARLDAEAALAKAEARVKSLEVERDILSAHCSGKCFEYAALQVKP